MLSKLIIVGLLIAIVAALGTAVVFLVRDPSSKRRTLRALAWRVGLQVALIVFLVLAFAMGWIQPHGVGG